MKQRIKILGIAPYEGMKSIMLKLAKDRTDIDVDVFVGDLDKGVEIARQNFHSNYDVIISRGGTAELIGRTTHIPVIEVSLSVYDILRAMKLAENYADRYAIVGFPAITGSAHLLCDLLQYSIDIFTIHDQSEVPATLKDLKRKGYRMVLCDMIANTIAKQIGLNAILITSGNESISSAFDQAVKLSSSYATLKSENHFLQEIIRGGGQQTVILSVSGEVFFSTLSGSEPFELLSVLQEESRTVLNNETKKFFKNIGGSLYSFTCQTISFQEQCYVVFYFTSNSVPLSGSKNGIRYTNCSDAEDQFFNSFYNITSAASNMQAAIENLNQTNAPVMLFGESGSGKEQVAKAIYAQSSLRMNPLITIDAMLLGDKSWNLITNHYNSPFNDNRNTIYIKDLTALTEARRKQLLSLMIDTKLCQRNRLIISCICEPGIPVPQEAVEFVNQLSCVTVHLSTLREHLEEIPTLTSLYLSSLNISMSNQIIGFEPDAMALLQQYEWPHNYTQFKRILNELALVTTTPYIRTEHVATLLAKEREYITPVTSGQNNPLSQLTLDRTLDEINQDIIRMVLDDCNGNQSAAAKRLGISRTTLWRLLK